MNKVTREIDRILVDAGEIAEIPESEQEACMSKSIWTDGFMLFAAELECPKIAEWLLQHDPSLCYAQSKYCHFIHGIYHVSIIKLVLELAPELLHHADEEGWLPIARWIVNYCDLGDSEVIDLIEKSLKGKDDVLKYANKIFYACTYRREPKIEIAKWLVEQYPALTKYQDYNDNTIMHQAAESGRIELVKYLLEKDPSLAFKQNKYGEIAINLSSRYDSEFFKLTLARHPELILIKDIDGRWSIEYAIRLHDLELCQWIMNQVEKTSDGEYVLKEHTS